jgi:thymidylate synthase
MNNLDLQYQSLLQTILDKGVEKSDRTGTGTKSIFGQTIRHNMQEGFPVLTTKKVHWRSVVTELIWFLRGDTNLKFLLENGCRIWTGDAYKRYSAHFAGHEDVPSIDLFENEVLKDAGFAERWGELGPIYGKQWRSWSAGSLEDKYGYGRIDQIENLIQSIKKNPDSRRLLVSAWNVGDTPLMILPPCHYSFQVWTRELSLKERFALWESLPDRDVMDFPIGQLTDEQYHESLDKIGVVRRGISLMFNMRSSDVFLGLPFNLASYGLLLEILSKEVKMMPDELIANLGDTHLYINHIDQAKEQLGREPLALPALQMMEDVSKALGEIPFGESVLQMKPADFVLTDYISHPPIKAPLSN